MNIRNDFETIKFEECEGVGVLTINRPSKLNALNKLVFTELKEVLTELTNDESYSVKGLLIIGSGDKSFIAGADIAEMDGMSSGDAKAFSEFGQEVSLLIENLPIPSIALVNGFALGGGLEMALSADFIYSTNNALFGLPEVSLGLIPGFGGTQRLGRVIGAARAKQLVYTAGKVDANTALQLGLTLEVFENREDLLDAGMKTLKIMFRNSPLAISRAKYAMNKGLGEKIEEGLKVEGDQFSTIFDSLDMKEGTKAFIEKRRPVFTGK